MNAFEPNPGLSAEPSARSDAVAERRADWIPAGLARPSGGSLRRALAWGLVWSAIGAATLYFLAPNPWPIQPSRATELRASLIVLDHGGPALLGYLPGTHAPYAIGSSDDQGIYVIVPVLSHWLGQSDPIAVLRWLWIAAWALALLFSAAVLRSLFRSSWAALLAPPTLLVCILSFGFGDIYWIAAWVVVTFMPLLVLLARNRPRRLWAALALIALVAGTCTAIRSNAGLPVAIAAAAVAVMAGRRWPSRVTVTVVVALAYLIPTWIVLPAIRAHRDHRVGVRLSANTPTSHPFWHSLYAGLGYTSNRYGIHYDDSYAAAAAQEADPGVRYLSPAYASALHGQVDALIEHDPGFMARVEVEKAVVELSHAGRYILLLALMLPAALTARGLTRLRRGELALFLPALVIGALPAVVAVPFRDYELTLFAPLGVLGLLTIGSAAARAEGEWIAAHGSTRGPTAHARLALLGLWGRWPRRLTTPVLLVAAVIVTSAFVFARHLEGEHERWDRDKRNPPTVVLAAAAADSPAAKA